MTKTRCLFFTIILFFSMFLTIEAVVNHIPTTPMECEVDKDCHNALSAEYLGYLLYVREQVICKNDVCQIIPL
jgi:hypothetical protein